MAVSIAEFTKALVSLQEVLMAQSTQQDPKIKEMLRDASIQRFEFTIELAVKVSIKSLGLNSMAPKPAIREMARAGLIHDIQAWFDFIEARNKSSHSYDEDVAKEVMASANKFVVSAEDLLARLKTK